MNRDHQPITVDIVNGLFNRSSFKDAIPTDHLSIADNLVYDQRGFATRPGTSLAETVGTIRRFVRYNRLNEVERFLILDESGNLYDSTNLGVPILTMAEMEDFSAVQYFNRIYITPHNRVTGIENKSVYVYDGTTCRIAGGVTPSGTLTVTNSALSGNVEAGTHLIAVAFESESGFISAPGPSMYGTVLADGSHQIDISGIPLGPAGTVARRILATRRIPSYNGDQEGYVFYFVPTGRIANNTSTTITLNFFDAVLLTEADYLFDQLQTIPAGVGIGIYANSLVVWGEYANPSVVRVSREGDPESFDGVSGYLTVAPNDSGGVQNVEEFRSSLYMMKNNRTYVTARDSVNPQSPIFWQINNVDEGIGTSPFGVAKVLDKAGPNTDNMIVASRVGIMLFNGIYMQPEFTWKIASLWQAMDYDNFNLIQLFNDVTSQRIYALMPDSTILVGDYQNGLSYTSVRWSRWTFPWDVTSIGLAVDDTTGLPVLYIAGDGNLWKLDSNELNDELTGISTKVKYAHQAVSTYGAIETVNSIRLRVRGTGVLISRLYGIDDTPAKVLKPKTLSNSPGAYVTRLANLQSERCAVELELDGAGERLEVTSMNIFTAPMWLERPNVAE